MSYQPVSTSTTQLRVGIYGTGAIGAHVGSWLAQSTVHHKSNIHITFLTRQHLYDQVNQSQCIEFSQVNKPMQRIQVPSQYINITTKSTDLASCNIILLCVKSMDTEQAAKDIDKFIQPNTIIISLQNGVVNKETIQSVLHQRCAVLSGIVEYNVTWQNNVQFAQRTSGRIIIENLPNNQHLTTLINAMKSVDLLAMTSDNIVSEQYSKLLLNLANSINALSGLSVSQMFRIRLIRHCYVSAIEEACTILSANNIVPAKILGKLPFKLFIVAFRLPDMIFSRISGMFVKTDEYAELSMTQDLKKQKLTEVEYINGQFVRLARQRGMQAPINEALCRLIHLAEEAKMRPAMPSVEMADAIHAPPLYSATRPSMYVLGATASLLAITHQMTKKANAAVGVV